MKEIVVSPNEIHFVPQSHRSLVLSLPLHHQLTLGDPLTWCKPICILLGDLVSNLGIMQAVTGAQVHTTITIRRYYLHQHAFLGNTYICTHTYIFTIQTGHFMTHSGRRKGCFIPALCHQSIRRDVQSDFTALKCDPQCGFLIGKAAIVLFHNL